MKSLHVKTKYFTLIAASFFIALGAGCGSAKKKKETPELSQYEGKKVALVEVEGESTARKVVEVALVNQLLKRGTFILIPKGEVEAARKKVEHDPTDLNGLARAAGAEIALRAKVIQFDATETSGYSSKEVDDEALEAERGDGKTTRYFKAKSLKGIVEVELEFFDLKSLDTRRGIAEWSHEVKGEADEKAIHLPPRLRFLEEIASSAFENFFDKFSK